MLMSNFMALKTGKLIIAIEILTNISRGKGNQVVKFGQLIEYSVKNVFLKNHLENETWKIVPITFFIEMFFQ